MHVLGIEVVPEGVVHAVKANIHKVEIVPLLPRQKPAHNLPLLPAHVENFLLERALLIVTNPEGFYVDWIFADQLVDFRFERGRIGEVALYCVRCEKTAYADAIHTSRRVIRRDADDD